MTTTTLLVSWVGVLGVLTLTLAVVALEQRRFRHSRRAAIACDVLGALWLAVLIAGMLAVGTSEGCGGLGLDGSADDRSMELDSRTVGDDDVGRCLTALLQSGAGGGQGAGEVVLRS